MNQSLLNIILGLFDDARWYLERIGDESYTFPLGQLSGASIGGHTRHFIEFFQCIVEKLHPDFRQADLVISYDQRRRNRSIETSARQALAVLDVLETQLKQLDCHETIWVGHTDYVAGKTWLLPSSAERELLYCIEHTVHHFALVRIGLRALAPALEVPPNFGVAPSTLRYRADAALAKTLTWTP